MVQDDDTPAPSARLLAFPVLDQWGLDELRAHVAALHAEITRAEAMIRRKMDDRGAADAMFRVR